MTSLLRMRFFLPLLVALIAAQTPSLPAAEKSAAPDRYVTLYAEIFARGEAAEAKLTPYDRLCLADVALRLETRTGQAAYPGKAAALFAAALPDVAAKPTDFHTLRMVTLLAKPLGGKGLLPPESVKLLQGIALRTWKEFLANPDGTEAGDMDHNIRLAEAFGAAGLANFFPDDPSPERRAIGPRLAAYWAKIKATGDLNEDASNYTALGIVHCIELAQALGHEEDLRSPDFRRMFARQRDIISATGVLPEFGDGFFHIDKDAFDFLFVCEYAAKAFDDPTFLTVARRLYDPMTYAKAPTDEWCRGTALIDMQLSTRGPAQLPAASVVSYRATREGPHPVADKLILRTGTEAGSAMIMLDLYADGSHAHRAKGPSVAYYEADGVPLFHNLGRHRTRSAITGNSFWALDGDQAFPGVWKPGAWFTMSIPADLFNRRADGDFGVGDRISFRNFENRGTRQLWFDNLRLEGTQGARLLDGFESPKGWHGNVTSAKGLKVETSPDHTQGAASQALNWGVLRAGVYARMLTDGRGFGFKPGEFDTLKLDLKYEGARPYMHIRDLCQQIDLGDHALSYEIGQAKVEQKGHDAFGEIVFNRYVARDARLTRHLILTAEGCLIIRDRWSAGSSRASWTAGQLWQLYALKEQGPSWFCSEDDGAYQVPDGSGATKPATRRMLVKFGAPAGTETFVEQVDQNYNAPNPRKRPQEKFFTTGNKRTVQAGEEASFTMVVVPHDPSQEAKSIADGIHISENAEGVQVKIGRSTEVTLRRDGRWEVARPPVPGTAQ